MWLKYLQAQSLMCLPIHAMIVQVEITTLDGMMQE